VTDGKTQLVGLIGWPVEHSLSPVMHNAAFDTLGLNWHYVPLAVRPGQVKTAIRGLAALGFRGANVTVPYKQAVLPFLDEITDTARAIGAVNTIVVQHGRFFGHNTDCHGFLAALRDAGFEPNERRALVLGAGGAARAVVYALAQSDCAVTVYNRTTERARVLAEDMRRVGVHAPVTWLLNPHALAELDLDRFDLLVNATSAGMWPDIDVQPWPDTIAFPAHWTVYDLVFNPAQTRLLSQAYAAGATAIGGLGMLVWQGAVAFEMWTGKGPVSEIAQLMYNACKRVLGKNAASQLDSFTES
jgi:shikimate dehydrogenase